MVKMTQLPSQKSEGVRRLSIFIGFMLSLIWIIFVLTATEHLSEIQSEGWIIVAVGLLIAFCIGWDLVQSVAWVVHGFKQSNK